MAERRMFAKTIVLSDAFLDMPMSARCLYFTLGMFADDDGFVNGPRAIMRQCGASDDDMKLLIAKKFVLLFESGVIVVKHWRVNNYLRSDRYIETKYADEKAQLSLDEKGIYHRSDPGIPGGIPTTVSPGKDSIGKCSVGEESIEQDNNNSSLSFEEEKQEKEEVSPERKQRVMELANAAAAMEKHGWASDSVYSLAKAEGISPAEINAARREAT